MRIVGPPTLLSAQKLASASASIRLASETSRTELATGRIADLPAALGGRIGEAFSLRAALDALGGRRQGLVQANLIATVAQRSLESIGEGVRAIGTGALEANGRRDEGALAVTARDARSRLEAAFSSLNGRVGGQAIFAGDATDGVAVSGADQLLADVQAIYASAATPAELDAALDFYFNDALGGYGAAIYQGGAGSAPTIEVSPGRRDNFTSRADDQSVRDTLRGLAVIAVAGDAVSSPLRDGALLSASASAISGSDGLTAVRAQIGVAEQRAAEALAALDGEEAALTEAYNGQTARDPLVAASRLQALESQLNASLVVTSRLSQLTLANFLR